MAVHDITEATLTKNARHIFPFLELPAELRNAIYDECLVDIHHRNVINEVLAIVQGLACPELKMVCRQVCGEYQARSRKFLTLVLHQETLFVDGGRVGELKRRLLPCISNIEVHMVFKVWAGSSTLELGPGYRLRAVRDMLGKWQNIKSLRIGFSFILDEEKKHEASVGADLQKTVNGEWMTLPHLQSMRLYPGHKLVKEWWKLREGDTIMEWSKETGKSEGK